MQEGFVGVGLRPTHYSHLESRLSETSPQILPKWFEAISENYMDSEGRPLEMLLKVRAKFPVALHGVSLSIGSTDPLDEKYLARLKNLSEKVEPFLVSDHLCWTGAHGRNLHDLLPLPFTKECVSHVASRIARVQDFLGRELVLENVSTYVRFKENDFSEWEFLNEICAKTGAKLLLDINNIYVNSANHGFDPYQYLDGVRKTNVAQIHLAGFTDMGDYLFDTHSKPVHEPVWNLFAHVAQALASVPVLIEWDEDIPPFETLEGEVRRALEVSNAARGLRLVKGPQ
ncbi:MAG: DUF692 domain-containing protein [Bdellovibrionia bacterium]